MLLDQPAADFAKSKTHAWSHEGKSRNVVIDKNDPSWITRLPRALTTDGARGAVGFTEGIHVWEIRWPRYQRGTHATVGVVTAEARLFSDGYVSLIGSDAESWGWDLASNCTLHNGLLSSLLSSPLQDDETVFLDVVRIVLDMDSRTLAFELNDCYLGVAFRNLPANTTLYPAIGAVWGNCVISINYRGGLFRNEMSLQNRCRFAYRNQLPSEELEPEHFARLNIPSSLKLYLQYLI